MKRSDKKLMFADFTTSNFSAIQFYVMIIWVDLQLRLLSSASEVTVTNDLS